MSVPKNTLLINGVFFGVARKSHFSSFPFKDSFAGLREYTGHLNRRRYVASTLCVWIPIC